MNRHPTQELATRDRWWALATVCFGALLTALDGTIVNIALPSIRENLAFSPTSLIWVVNAYLLTLAGFLLLSGRLADLFGHRRLFLLGVALFTLASLGCGLARSQWLLIGARAIQGIGAAIISASALSLTMTLFSDARQRAKAMGLYAFVSGGGQSIGLLAGGMLISVFSWRSVFLVNLPLGCAVYALGQLSLPREPGSKTTSDLDVGGAVSVTASLTLAAYAIVVGSDVGWTDSRTAGSAAGALFFLILFALLETRIRSTLIPLALLRRRNLLASSSACVLVAAAMLGWTFICTMYMQLVLGYTPMQVALAFLSSSLSMAAFSVGVAPTLVTRLGNRLPLVLGLTLVAGGLLLFARAPVNGNESLDVIPGMIILGVGAALSWNSLYLAAMADTTPAESGLASGIVNTASMFGCALGLAILAGVAAARTRALSASGVDLLGALNGGYHLAFAVAALFIAGAAVAAAGLRFQQSASLSAGMSSGPAVEGHER